LYGEIVPGPTGFGHCVVTPSPEIVRAKLDAGLLPLAPPAILWILHGSGEACAVCEQPILNTQTQYEAEYDRRPAIRFHAACHRVWQAELRARGVDPTS
jgi:hypothetical protein